MSLILSETFSLEYWSFDFPLNADITEIPLKKAKELAMRSFRTKTLVWSVDEQHIAELFSRQLDIPIADENNRVPVVKNGDKVIVGMVVEGPSPRFPRELNQLSCSVTGVVRWFEIAIFAQKSKP